MSTIGTSCYHRPWFIRMFGKSRFKIELDLGRGWTASAEGSDVEGAWNGALLVALVLHGVRVTSPCPFDAKGRAVTGVDQT